MLLDNLTVIDVESVRLLVRFFAYGLNQIENVSIEKCELRN